MALQRYRCQRGRTLWQIHADLSLGVMLDWKRRNLDVKSMKQVRDWEAVGLSRELARSIVRVGTLITLLAFSVVSTALSSVFASVKACSVHAYNRYHTRATPSKRACFAGKLNLSDDVAEFLELVHKRKFVMGAHDLNAAGDVIENMACVALLMMFEVRPPVRVDGVTTQTRSASCCSELSRRCTQMLPGYTMHMSLRSFLTHHRVSGMLDHGIHLGSLPIVDIPHCAVHITDCYLTNSLQASGVV